MAVISLQNLKYAICEILDEKFKNWDEFCRKYTDDQIERHGLTCKGKCPSAELEKRFDDLSEKLRILNTEKAIEKGIQAKSTGGLSKFNKIMIALAIVGTIGISNLRHILDLFWKFK